MARKKTYRSGALRSAHLAAQDLHTFGVFDKATMRWFDKACLTDIEELSSDAIRRIRDKARMSQAIFA